MEESNNLLAALQTMLKMKNAEVEPTAKLEPEPSTSSAKKRPHASDQSSPTKKRRLEHSVRKSIGNTFASIPIRVNENIDMNEFLNNVKDEIRQKISEELNERNALKFYLIVKAQLSRTTSDGDEQLATPYFCSVPKIILHSTDIADEIDIAGERVKELLATHEGQGSGFKLDLILECQLQVATYDRIGGTSYIRLPKYIQNKKATVNVKNVSDQNCFQYSVLYAKFQPEVHPEKLFHYKKHLAELDMTGIRTPVEITQIKKFEKQNCEYSLNVYAMDELKTKTKTTKRYSSLCITPKSGTESTTQICFSSLSGDKRHYVVIKNLSRFLQGRTAEHNKYFVCKYCL